MTMYHTKCQWALIASVYCGPIAVALKQLIAMYTGMVCYYNLIRLTRA